MKQTLCFVSILLISLFTDCAFAQGYVSPFKYQDGTFVMKSSSEIRKEESDRSAKSALSIKKEYNKPKNGYNSSGQYWINGFCRYRPASHSASNYSDDITEVQYHEERYPTDIIVYTDDFKGGGNIPWAENAFNKEYRKACESFLTRLPSYVSDGIPGYIFDSLMKSSYYDDSKQRGTKQGRVYEFSRAVSASVKRMEGSDKAMISFTGYFPFVNSEDKLSLYINDKGKYMIYAYCENCEKLNTELSKGEAKTWKTGDWNELTMKKDEYNNILVYANEELLYQYHIPFVPIATHFGGFSLGLPYEQKKNGLKYNIRRITSIHYPKIEAN